MWKFLVLIIFILILEPTFANVGSNVFRLHVNIEPTQFDPSSARNSSYILNSIHRTLYQYTNTGKLKPDLAEKCYFKTSLTVICKIKSAKWSDGSKITAQNIVESFRNIFLKKSFRASLFFSIEGSQALFESTSTEKPNLGVKTLNQNTIEFKLNYHDSDFVYKLTNTLSAPYKSETVFSGPYMVYEWQKSKIIKTKPNPHFDHNYLKRPEVHFYVIQEDSTALNLYEKNQLDYLRRLPTLFISQYKNRKDFFEIPQHRFDYIGFNPQLDISIRKTLAQTPDYLNLKKMFQSKDIPGCPGIDSSWMKKQICIRHQSNLKSASENKKILNFWLSKQGGDDHKRFAEWIQSEWKKSNLDVKIEIKEDKIFTQELITTPPDIFRKGIALDRPTCLSAIEKFLPDNNENYIQLKSEKFNKIINKLKSAKNETEKRTYCSEGISYLLNNYLLVPTGAYSFAILAKTNFVGWKLNPLNQLNLVDLRSTTKPSEP